MNCDEFVELVTAFLDGAMGPDAEAQFVEHLAVCDGCERYLEQFRQTIQLTGELPGDGLSPDARAELLSAFRKLT